MNKLWFFGLVLALLSACLVQMFKSMALKRGLIDIPNARSSHEIPTPKGGGIAFVIVWGLSQMILWYLEYITVNQILLFLPGACIVAVLGFLDDVHTLSAGKRFLVQFMAALLCVGTSLVLKGQYELMMLCLVPLAVIGLMWSINLFNFMDGLDGLAAVEAIFVLGVGGVVCWFYGQTPLALIAGSMAFAVLGFLSANWPKASIFMGGVGSYPLGFLVGALAGVSTFLYEVPIVLWVILYGVFWFDATLTLLRRMLNKEPWTKPHRSHAYQRLHQAGFSHQQVLWCVIALNSVLSLIVWGIMLRPEWMWEGAALALGVLVGAYAVVERLRPMST
jgi:glycosyltransferase WbpL